MLQDKAADLVNAVKNGKNLQVRTFLFFFLIALSLENDTQLSYDCKPYLL